MRRESTVPAFHQLGVHTLYNKPIILRQVAASDIVFYTATADHLPSVEAILDGIRRRARRGQQTIYIHTNGATVLGDTSRGLQEQFHLR